MAAASRLQWMAEQTFILYIYLFILYTHTHARTHESESVLPTSFLFLGVLKEEDLSVEDLHMLCAYSV